MAVIEGNRAPAAAPAAAEWWDVTRLPLPAVVVGGLLLIAPLIANDFVLVQIVGWAMILGIIALSLMFLAGYGNMVSLAQMTVAGMAAYATAFFGVSGVTTISLGWPWWLAVPVALLVGTLFGTFVGALAVRTEGIYTIMITLAVAAATFYLTRQNYGIFNGYDGFNQVTAPVFWGVNWRAPIPFYYMTLALALLALWAVVYVSRSPFGLALQGVRDNPRRMAALGFNVTAHRIAAYAFASFLAAIGGVLIVWLNARVSPGTISVNAAIDILIIAVLGGITHPIGAFIGAIIYVILRTFALDLLVSVGLAGERFQLLIGLGFLAIVFFSSDGILGLWRRFRERTRRDPLTGERR